MAYCYHCCITHFCFDWLEYSIVRRILPQLELSPDIIKISNLSIELLIFTSTLQRHLCIQFISSLIIWTILLVLKADGNLSKLECVSTPLPSKKHKHILVFKILLSVFDLHISFMPVVFSFSSNFRQTYNGEQYEMAWHKEWVIGLIECLMYVILYVQLWAVLISHQISNFSHLCKSTMILT